MGQYIAPLHDMQFVLHELLGVENHLKEMPQHTEIDADTINQVIEEADKLYSGVIFPLNRSDDREGCTYRGDGMVTAPKGLKETYQQYVETGQPSLGCDPEYSGRGPPILVNNALYEMLNSANQAWMIYPGLSHDAYEALHAHGTDELKQRYLPKLVPGMRTGTMCLIEPHHGIDLGVLRTRAEPSTDGSYAITSTKIFISAGEHDLTENIIRLVPARLPNVPGGTRDISLFVVPKFTPDAGSDPGGRNTVKCGFVEHRMSIHGNATCVINLDGARGWMVDEPNKGLNAIFVTMNTARLGVDMQGLGLTKVAYQNSTAYAKEHLQVHSLSGLKAPNKPADPVVVHPDMHRMLLTQRAFIEGGRAFSYQIALQIDRELSHSNESTHKDAADLVALLTPITRAFLGDNAFIPINEGIQIFGGHGYIAEWGVEQYVRDAHIDMIYKSTNTMQSLDLLSRKILDDMGAKMRKFSGLVQDFVEAGGTNEVIRESIDPLTDIGDKIQKLTTKIGMKAMASPDEVGTAAVPYLRVVGHLVLLCFWARMAKIIPKKQDSGDSFYEVKLATVHFYFAKLLPETASQIRMARAGGAVLMTPEADLF